MDELVNGLQNMDCDMQSTLSRFLDDTEFYAECLSEMLNDGGFEQLERELQREDAQAAFATAHMLKGIIANLGITSMFEIVVKMVEPLRAGQAAGLMPVYEELMADKMRYDTLLKELGL